MVSHLADQGHRIEVLFTGWLYDPDLEALSTHPANYHLSSLGSISQTTTDDSQKGERHWARKARRMVKQLGYETVRFLGRHAGRTGRRFRLQLQEPKLRDHFNPGTLARFMSACERLEPEVVIIEYVRLAWVLERGARALPSACLTVIDTHDLQHERQQRFHASAQVHDIDITATEEARALRVADVILAIQPTDAAKLKRLLPEQQVIVASYPAQLYKHPAQSGSTTTIGFFGSDMLPNRQAVQALIERIMPRLSLIHGDAVELHVFGGVCGCFSNTRLTPGVVLRGFVQDLATAYSTIDIIANPVEFGGGLKIKNVEALCHGRPLVTTMIGAEGLEDGIGKAFLIAANESEFVELLDRLVRHPELRRTFNEHALAYASRHFTEEAAYRELDRVICGVSE